MKEGSVIVVDSKKSSPHMQHSQSASTSTSGNSTRNAVSAPVTPLSTKSDGSSSSNSNNKILSNGATRMQRSVPPVDRMRRDSSSSSSRTLVYYSNNLIPHITDAGECPSCGSGAAIRIVGYWKEYRAPVLVCTFTRTGKPRDVCGWQWIAERPRAMCTCSKTQLLLLERRFGQFYYVCSVCQTIGFNSMEGGPPMFSDADDDDSETDSVR